MGSALFASARVKSREAKFVGRDRLYRMADADTPQDALKIIYETSYAEGVMINNPSEYQKMIYAETENLLALFREICPDEKVTQCFLSEYDYRNAKALVKAKYKKEGDYGGLIYENGTIPNKQLAESIKGDNYTFLPKPMAEALKAVDINYASYGLNPSVWDILLTNAMYEDWALQADKCGKVIKGYFSLKADTENFLTALKCKIAGLPASFYDKQFVGGGSIGKKSFESVISSPYDSLGEIFRNTALSGLAGGAAKNIEKEGITAAEREAENDLNAYFAGRKDMIDTVYPLLNYYLYKLAEIKNINIIFTGKTGGAEKEEIKKRLRNV